MNKLKCEICGGTDIVKKDGVFVCETCGVKYSVEELQALLADANAEEKAKPDISSPQDSFMILADTARTAGSWGETEVYVAKMLEKHPYDVKAWFMRGEAVGHMYTPRKDSLDKTVEYWKNAYTYSSQREDLKATIHTTIMDLIYHLLDYYVDNFTRDSGSVQTAALSTYAAHIQTVLNDLTIQCDISFDRAYLCETTVMKIHDPAKAIFKNAMREYGTGSYATIAEWDYTVGICTRILHLTYDLLPYCRSTDTAKIVYETLIYMLDRYHDLERREKVGDAMLVVNRFSDERKGEMERYIRKFQNEVKKCEGNIFDVPFSDLTDIRINGAVERANRRYWEAHPEEKRNLEKEKELLGKDSEQLAKDLCDLETVDKAEQLQKQIYALQDRKTDLGFFHKAEKEELQRQIDVLSEEYHELSAKASKEQAIIEHEIRQQEKRIAAIDTYIHGHITTGSAPVFEDIHMTDACADGKFTFTPETLFTYLERVFPDDGVYCLPYNEAILQFWQEQVFSAFKGWKPVAGMGVEYRTAFGSNTPISVHIAVVGKDPTAVCEGIAIIANPIFFQKAEERKDWILIVSRLLTAVDASLEQNEAELTAASILFGKEHTYYAGDGIRVELLMTSDIHEAPYHMVLIRPLDK